MAPVDVKKAEWSSTVFIFLARKSIHNLAQVTYVDMVTLYGDIWLLVWSNVESI